MNLFFFSSLEPFFHASLFLIILYLSYTFWAEVFSQINVGFVPLLSVGQKWWWPLGIRPSKTSSMGCETEAFHYWLTGVWDDVVALLWGVFTGEHTFISLSFWLKCIVLACWKDTFLLKRQNEGKHLKITGYSKPEGAVGECSPTLCPSHYSSGLLTVQINVNQNKPH